VAIEVFPKQNSVPPRSLGNLIKLPLGIHRVTGRWARFLDSEGQPVDEVEPSLQRVRRLPAEALRETLEQHSRPWIEAEEPGAVDLPAPMILEPDYQLETDDRLQRLLLGCAVLRTLVDQVESQGSLEHAEVQVLTYTVGHLPTGPQAINTLLRRCPGQSAHHLMGRQQRGMPMSCASIRKRILKFTSGLPCDCPFPPGLGTYPNPLLHLAVSFESLDGQLGRQQLQALVSDYLRVRREIDALLQRLQTYRQRLEGWFEQAETEELELPIGSLRKRVGPEGEIEFEIRV